jgi:hypothetical protein
MLHSPYKSGKTLPAYSPLNAAAVERYIRYLSAVEALPLSQQVRPVSG